VIALARELGITVVAEGVENDQQLAILRAMGCRFAQGYLFARARAAERISPAIPLREKRVARALA
jgi:EAL domain-containing protein (putative c-di-GMP-specific phosphodiesterase class I)